MNNMETYKVKVTKLSDNKNAFRTNDMFGVCVELPTPEKCFLMFGEGLEFGTRLFRSSLVQSVEQIGDSITFVTLNSTYRLDILSKE